MKYIFLGIGLILLAISAINAQALLDSSHLPIFVINTDGQVIEDVDRIKAHMGVIFNAEGAYNRSDDPFNEYDGQISIEIRGYTSRLYPKKQYALETQDENGENRNVPLLGLPKENDWILQAPYSDKTLIRNQLSTTISEKLGNYAPRMRFCELVLNGEYKGIYILVEKIKRDKNRLNLSKLNESDTSGMQLSGGYVLKIDRANSWDKFWLTSKGGVRMILEYPDKEDITVQQEMYIQHYIEMFESALYADSGKHNGRHFTDYIDLQSFVDFFIVNELAKNIDAYRFSTFLYKDRDDKGGKLKMGPVWDFNIAYGNVDYQDGFEHDGFVADSVGWWKEIVKDTLFINALKERWGDLRLHVLADTNMEEMIDSLVMLCDDARRRNFEKWNIIGKDIWPNYFVGNSYEQDIAFMKNWINDRLLWMDAKILDQTTNGSLNLAETQLNVFPNPYHFELTFEIKLEKNSRVTALLYSAQGQLLHEIVNKQKLPKGRHKYTYIPENLSLASTPKMEFMVVFIDGAFYKTIKLLH